MIDCREAVGRMWAYLSHGLEHRGTAELEEHLGACQRCCGELEFSRQLRDLVAQVDDARMPPAVRSRIDDLIATADGPAASGDRT